jgi:L-ascorbate metabolism protein UlaG (beta-lactamase superfamily)
MTTATITLIGGPTALVELDGFRLLTDPTFGGPGEYTLPHMTRKKTAKPALGPDQIGPVDAVLLSHDQHSDNLDTSGRAFLQKADRVFTTEAGADRLGGNAQGLRPWATAEISNGIGGAVRRHRDASTAWPVGIEPYSGAWPWRAPSTASDQCSSRVRALEFAEERRGGSIRHEPNRRRRQFSLRWALAPSRAAA